MQAAIQKWGNSQAIRLPKSILAAAEMLGQEKVEIIAEKGCITIRPLAKTHLTLNERIAGYNGEYPCTEWDTGLPTGNEEW